MSQKTLETAFKKQLNMTPGKCLVVYRPTKVRKELQSSSRDQTISFVALKNGFSHLGRFSKVYREFFGELPSHTARHP